MFVYIFLSIDNFYIDSDLEMEDVHGEDEMRQTGENHLYYETRTRHSSRFSLS